MTIARWWKELPLEPAIDFLEHRVSPIFVKEIRLILREKLFVTSHLLMLAVMGIYVGGSLLVAYFRHGSGARLDAADTGVSLYEALQILQLFAMTLILPGVTATLISSERESGTFEMLLSASMSPRRILWGKLLSALSITFLVMVSVLPMSLAAPIVGGVELGHVFRWYGTLTLISILMATLSLTLSSVARSAAHAIIGSYAAAVAVVLGLSVFSGELGAWGVYDYSASVFGFVRPDYLFPGVFSGSSKEILLGLALPVGAAILVIGILYGMALYSITPPHPSRPVTLKGLLLSEILGAELLCGIAGGVLPAGSDLDVRVAQGLSVFLAMAALFATDDVVFPIESRRRGLAGAFQSGAENGLFYSWILILASGAAYAWLFSELSRHSVEIALGLAGWGFFCSAMAFLLRLLLPSPKGAQMLYAGLVLLTLALPVILDAIVSYTVSPRDFNPFALISPLIFAALAGRYDLDWGLYFPAAMVATGLLLLLAAWPLLARHTAPETESA